MSSHLTLARPYARAAFETAREEGTLADWSRKLAFSAAVAAHPQARALIGNPRLGAEQLAQLFLPEGEAAGTHYAGFLATLIANRRLALLPEIAELFGEFRRDHERVLRVTVRAAVAVEPAQAEALAAALQRRFGRSVEMHTVVDPSVLGGAVIDAGEVVIDGSVRGRLAQLAASLAH